MTKEKDEFGNMHVSIRYQWNGWDDLCNDKYLKCVCPH
jgi:hypothetical protein